MKHLTKTLALVSLLTPMPARPLAIGDLQLHSALNEKLNADIRLHLSAGENPADVAVRLAPPEKFDQAGVPWNYFLTKLKFQTVVMGDRTLVVKITSREPLTEPFLDFLLEVSWPQGNQIREYTALIDPPTDYLPPAVPVAGNNTYSAEPLEEEYQAPVRQRQPRPTTTKPAGSGRQAQPSRVTPQTASDGEYGPIQPADSLWRIAEQLAAERNVPTAAMMQALFQANPDAFYRDDMDALKAGVKLKIPVSEAIAQPGETHSASKTGRKTAPPAAQAANGGKALELVAPADGQIGSETGSGAQIKPGSSNGGSSAGSATATANGQDSELQSRIERLEQQLNMMQELLALKDQQLAALQSGQAAAPTTPAQPLAPSAEPAAAPEASAPAQQPASAETIPAPAAEQAQPAPATPVTPPPPVSPPPATQADEDFFSSDGYYLTVGGLGAGILAALGWLLWRKRKLEAQNNTDSLFANASQIRMPDSDGGVLSVPVLDLSATSAYDVGTVGESSFISDFTPSDFEAFDTDQTEIDPLSEADVYLAYGRYQQAEELIRTAIQDQPNKNEFKLKLLEIFYANENKEAFEKYAQELAGTGKAADTEFWEKVTDMAKEIAPDSALFGNTAANTKTDTALADQAKPLSTPSLEEAFLAEHSVDNTAQDDELADLRFDAPIPAEPSENIDAELDFDLSEFAVAEPPEELAPEEDNGLDFDLTGFADTAAPQQVTETEDAGDIESIEFDLSGFESEKPAASEEKPLAADAGQDDLESFDFNFDLEEVAAADAPAETEDMASLESFDFPAFGESLSEETVSADAGLSPLASGEPETLDDFDFNFDFDNIMPIGGPAEQAPSETDLGVSDLTDMDEYETKIDLAKAYIDMGDAEAAKSIAEEVLQKGNQEQKQAAKALLDELG